MEESKIIKILTKGNQLLMLDKRILQFSSVLQGIPNYDEDIFMESILSDQLLIIYSFYESNNFQIPPYSKKLISNNLEENMGRQMDFIKQFLKENNNIQIEKVKSILQLAYQLDFKEVQDYLLLLLTNDIYCGESNLDFQQFKQKSYLEDLTQEEEIAIMQAFRPVFDNIDQIALEEYDKLQKEQENK